VRSAIHAAWGLNENRRFVEVFRETVSKLSGRTLANNAYAVALNKMVINHADTARTPVAVRAIATDERAKQQSPLFRPPPAFSVRDGSNVWIRTFRLKDGTIRQLTADVMHEAAHLVGAPSDELAEFALEKLHNTAGLPR
jgi:hypothetical protein